MRACRQRSYVWFAGRWVDRADLDEPTGRRGAIGRPDLDEPIGRRGTFPPVNGFFQAGGSFTVPWNGPVRVNLTHEDEK